MAIEKEEVDVAVIGAGLSGIDGESYQNAFQCWSPRIIADMYPSTAIYSRLQTERDD